MKREEWDALSEAEKIAAIEGREEDLTVEAVRLLSEHGFYREARIVAQTIPARMEFERRKEFATKPFKYHKDRNRLFRGETRREILLTPRPCDSALPE
jgi:hypothetical protein